MNYKKIQSSFSISSILNLLTACTFNNYLVITFLVLFLSVVKPAMGSGIILIYSNGELHLSGKELLVDMGKVDQGAVCGTTIRLKNESEQVLKIVNVRGSCGLTAPSWPRQPLLPGQEAVIQVRYDSSRLGNIDRNLTINANTSTSVTILKVTGEIVER
jgi:hypothetical protein